MLQLILELGELRNNVFALDLLFRVFSLANCLVQVINSTCLMCSLVSDRGRFLNGAFIALVIHIV